MSTVTLNNITYNNVENIIYNNKEVNKLIVNNVIQWERPILEPTSILEENSWAQISYASNNGLASTLWKIGDSKKITINGADHEVIIIGFNHDTRTDNGQKAGITFQLNSSYTKQQMNSTNTNSGGWANCKMRTEILPSIFYQLENSLQQVIVQVDKIAGTNTVSDKLFLLSEYEAIGRKYKSAVNEGTKYNYYDSNSKFNKSGGNWWLRSVPSSNTTSFCYYQISTDGTSFGSFSTTSASQTLRPYFAFCV